MHLSSKCAAECKEQTGCERRRLKWAWTHYCITDPKSGAQDCVRPPRTAVGEPHLSRRGAKGGYAKGWRRRVPLLPVQDFYSPSKPLAYNTHTGSILIPPRFLSSKAFGSFPKLLSNKFVFPTFPIPTSPCQPLPDLAFFPWLACKNIDSWGRFHFSP